jgi:epoxyqueuosine reductase
MNPPDPEFDEPADLALQVRAWAAELGFDAVGICATDLDPHDERLRDWLANGYHGEMEYMARHGARRWNPAELVPGTLRIISVRMDYLHDGADPVQVLERPEQAYIARYALGRDYHKVMRNRLEQLAQRLRTQRPQASHRVFVDSAPVLERGVAQKAGLGWIGKNTMLINPQIGSYTLIGTIFTDLKLVPDLPPVTDHCGTCTRCLDICPTEAFVTERVLDATRCLSYLTIEHRRDPPPELHASWDGWAFGCDACNDVCPWNVKFAEATTEPEYAQRPHPDRRDPAYFDRLTEAEFAEHFAETPLARPGLDRMRRNTRLAVASRHPERP